MGTRSIIKFVEKWQDAENELVTIYQQYDGYINGVGYKLAEWLKEKTIVNGFGSKDVTNCCNGAGCLAAQFIKDFKDGIGYLYIYPSDCEPQDYNYRVLIDETKTGKADDLITIVVTNWDETEPIFVGSPSELLKFKED